MPYNILLIPLIGGYYFLSNFVFFRFKYQRVSSHRLLLNAALAGNFIGFFSFISKFFFQIIAPNPYKNLSSLLATLFHSSPRYLWTMVFGLFLTITVTHLGNWFINIVPLWKELPIRNAIKNYGDELEQLCLDSILHGFALQVTLKNDKIYIGFVEEAPIPSKTNYLLLRPLYSGFRDPKTKKMELNTSYGPIIDSLVGELDDKKSIMNVVIKQDEILTLSPHDPDIYSRFHHE